MSSTWPPAGDLDEASFKACCATAFESPLLSYLVGPAWRPGGTRLTEEMALRLRLGPESLIFDLASGLGETARLLSSRIGCGIVGLDLSAQIVRMAARGPIADPVPTCPPSFLVGDAECLPLASNSFDAVICECALSTFPDKRSALKEVARVLQPGGRFAMADVTLEIASLPESLGSVWGRVACLADALPSSGYTGLLEETGFLVESIVDCRQAARDFLTGIDRRLLLARIGQALGKFALPGVDIKAARALLKEALALVDAGQISYAYFLARTATY